MIGHGGSSAGSYLADPRPQIPSHCVVIILFKSVTVHQLSCLALKELTCCSNLSVYRVQTPGTMSYKAINLWSGDVVLLHTTLNITYGFQCGPTPMLKHCVISALEH